MKSNVTSYHKVILEDGRVMYVCDSCGGFYNTVAQASHFGNSSNQTSHYCRSRPK